MPLTRQTCLAGFVICALAISVALFLEHVLKMEPCPLCVLSRVMVMFTAMIFLAALIHNPKALGKKIYSVIGIIFCLMGVALNIRHLWLQSLPADQTPACGPGIEYLMQTLAPIEVLKHVLAGSGECADVQATLLGLSLPAWTLGLFVVLAALWIYPAIKKG